jgi:hypothetical protein
MSIAMTGGRTSRCATGGGTPPIRRPQTQRFNPGNFVLPATVIPIGQKKHGVAIPED